MAKKMTDDFNLDLDVATISQEEFKKLLKKVSNAESRMAEAKGEAGGVIETAISRHNLHKEAFRVIRKYVKKDPAAAKMFKDALDTYWEYSGLSEIEEVAPKPKRGPGRPKGSTKGDDKSHPRVIQGGKSASFDDEAA